MSAIPKPIVEKRNAYMLLVGKPEGKSPLGTDFLDNVGVLTSHNPIGLHGLLRG
jgi:hypothetical protein